MNRYEVTKIVFAKNISEIMYTENSGEITNINLKEDVKDPSSIGFTKQYVNKSKRKRN